VRVAIAACSGETTSVPAADSARQPTDRTSGGSGKPSPAVPDDREWRAIEGLLAVTAPEGIGKPAHIFATELLGVLTEHVGGQASAEIDRDDGRGLAPLVGISSASTPDATQSRAQRVPLDLAPPWRGHIWLPEHDVPSDLAARLAAQRLTAALEFERLRHADLRRQAWMTYLVEVGNLLAHSLDTALTEALIPRLIVPRLAPWCALYIVDDGGKPRIASVTHIDEGVAANMLSAHHFLGTRLNGRDMVDAVLEAGGPVVFDGPACLMIPLQAHGQRIGALALGREGTVDAETVSIAEEVARRAATALDNARVHHERQHVARTLQEALLPVALPDIPGLGIGASYLPAGSHSQVGGDMYDLIPTHDGGCIAVIGDVAGKGVHAAAVTGIVREVLRVLIADGKPIDQVLQRLNEAILSRSQRYCTMVLAQVRRSAAAEDDLAVTVYLAGHEQPLVIRRGGAVATVGQWGTALGVLSRVHCVPEQVMLHPGDSLLLFTDGLTERRSGKEFFGLERVCQAATQFAAHPAGIVAEGLASTVLGFSEEVPQDDITVVTLRNDHPVPEPER
jgi:serine phosphatase RsbU (regulator of sigma subunit)